MKPLGRAKTAPLGLSLPTRERELKQRLFASLPARVRSLPTRERELKLPRFPVGAAGAASLPTRERELKHSLLLSVETVWKVAPHAGA